MVIRQTLKTISLPFPALQALHRDSDPPLNRAAVLPKDNIVGAKLVHDECDDLFSVPASIRDYRFRCRCESFVWRELFFPACLDTAGGAPRAGPIVLNDIDLSFEGLHEAAPPGGSLSCECVQESADESMREGEHSSAAAEQAAAEQDADVAVTPNKSQSWLSRKMPRLFRRGRNTPAARGEAHGRGPSTTITASTPTTQQLSPVGSPPPELHRASTPKNAETAFHFLHDSGTPEPPVARSRTTGDQNSAVPSSSTCRWPWPPALLQGLPPTRLSPTGAWCGGPTDALSCLSELERDGLQTLDREADALARRSRKCGGLIYRRLRRQSQIYIKFFTPGVLCIVSGRFVVVL